MKRALFGFMVMSVASVSIAAPIKTVSKFDFGDKWPFTREEVMINCRDNGALLVINPATLVQYPINDIAQKMLDNKQIKGTDIAIIVKDSEQESQKKQDLTPIIEAANALCEVKK